MRLRGSAVPELQRNFIVFVVESAAALKDFYYLLLISRFLDFAKIKPGIEMIDTFLIGI